MGYGNLEISLEEGEFTKDERDLFREYMDNDYVYTNLQDELTSEVFYESTREELKKVAKEKKLIGIWGSRRLEYLREYYSRECNQMLLNGKLIEYLIRINEQALNRISTVTEQLLKTNPLPPDASLEDEHHLRMYIQRVAEENVYEELVYPEENRY